MEFQEMGSAPGVDDHVVPLGERTATEFMPLWFAARPLTQEPHPRIGPTKEVDLIAGEVEALQQQFCDRLPRVERKSNAQVLIGKQLLDHDSNTSL
jgi:hypothetical protein